MAFYQRRISFALAICIFSITADQTCADEAALLARAPIHRYSFDGKGGPGTELSDSIGKRDGQIFLDAAPKALPYHEGSTTLVVLPDTEVYCAKRSGIFLDMMDWIAENKEQRKIEYVLHVGDITNNNHRYEWAHARKAFDVIEGKIPYVLAAGNHDYDHTEGRLTYMNEQFRVADQKKWRSFGDVYEEGKLENHYQLMEINGQKWIVLSLEMGPRDGVIDWANKVLTKHKDRLAIILTHAFLYYDNQRYNHEEGNQRASPYNFYGEGADGEILWNLLVRRHSNVMMLICGHLSSQYVGYRKDRGVHGNLVHQMLVDYEKLKGGRGFLRLLEFLPDGKTIQVRTYSPVSHELRSPVTKGDQPLQDPKLEEFVFTLQAAPGQEKLLAATTPNPAAKPIRNDNVPEGTIYAGLNGLGQFVIAKNDGRGYGKLDVQLVKGRQQVSFEVWFTPTETRYSWSPVVEFHGGKDAFYYKFRTLNTHRAELIFNGHNEDIQRQIDVEVGKPIHVVVTYDQEGHDGQPLLSSYVNGKPTGQMVTGIKLSELALEHGRIGPFAGKFDELRVYDYPLRASEVLGNFERGPSRIEVQR